MNSPFKGFSKRFKSWLDKFLSARVKRYILLTSYWSYFKNAEEIDKQTLKKLNDLMTMRTTEHSLYIPALLGKVIWKDSLGNIVKTVQLDGGCDPYRNPEIIKKFLDNIPSCLTYDKRDVIEQEINNLTRCMSV